MLSQISVPCFPLFADYSSDCAEHYLGLKTLPWWVVEGHWPEISYIYLAALGLSCGTCDLWSSLWDPF